VGGSSDCLDGSEGCDSHLNACARRFVSKKLQSVANCEGKCVLVDKELVWVVNEATKGRAARVIVDSS